MTEVTPSITFSRSAAEVFGLNSAASSTGLDASTAASSLKRLSKPSVRFAILDSGAAELTRSVFMLLVSPIFDHRMSALAANTSTVSRPPGLVDAGVDRKRGTGHGCAEGSAGQCAHQWLRR